jgi:hypothetical protein
MQTASIRKYAAVVTDEVLETGQNVLLGPDADIVRLPWWGRINETPVRIRRGLHDHALECRIAFRHHRLGRSA